MIPPSEVTGEICDLNQLAQNFPQDVLARPMDVLGKQLAIRMRGFCPVGRKGNLQKSISNKTQVYASKNATVGIVGPRRNAPGRPTKYAALVEFGHVARGAITNGNGGHVAARPFVRPTAEIARTAAVEILGPSAAGELGVAVKRAGMRKIGKKRQIISTAF